MNEPKFDHPALEELYATLSAIEETEAQVKALKQQLYKDVESLPEKIGDNEDLRDEIFHHLYWFNEKVPATALRQAFQMKIQAHAKKGALEKLTKKAYLKVSCKECKEPFHIEVTSRDHLLRQRSYIEKGWGKTCPKCEALKSEATKQRYEQEQREWENRLYELHNMPYYDYLQTPEWQERRKRSMKRAGFRCQVCNAYGVRLNVHHRTYERRGYEEDRDLIVLCANCHQIFHDNGSLAEE